ncbi:MAG: TRAP transporter small permease [Polaromonas sp.]|uniref:TRAP transporter small permease n=1 Tax=Polaromonas sp. TaxID=1869339 RepID=UPI00272F9A45|nr:TRAP transporter small permease [Polaromonas sp.]MDP1742299.1 TRAP transporter small permease [Polaromonas sp.]MDP1954439.1 TRAP transporter small permease [Polaromonas sp.]MDP3357086.1 TRAP transporter small permease [Polaromonas sp.]MDP3753592.1 TRAP transporter small permease [Polaromonas sp.]
MVQKIIDRYCQFLCWLMAASLALMVVLVFTNVVLRYAFNSGISVSEELSRWLFVWLTFLGAIVALNERAHLGTDTLVSRLPVLGKKICLGLGHVLMLFVCWLLFKGTLDQVKINWDSTSAAMEVSMALFYGCGLVFAVSGAVILLRDFWRLLTGQLADSELVGIRESEDVPHAPTTAAR